MARLGAWPEPPGAPVQSALLREVERWFYYIDVNLDEETVDEIAASAYELVVLDFIPSEQQNTDYPMREVTDWLHDSHDGRLVLAYIDIGQAESFRTYWQPEWRIGEPVWIAGGDPDGWEGNFPVAFWHDEWREIWLGDGGYLDGVLGHGFDGVYLDWVEAYSDENVLRIADDDGVDAREKMIAWVADIAEFGRDRRPGFIVIGQNAAELAEDPEYLSTIDAIAQEQVWFDGSADNDPPGDCPLPRTDADVDSDAYYNSLSQDCQRQFDEFPDSTLHVSSEDYLHYLELAREAGRPVFTVDYAVEPENVAWVYRESRSHGFVPFASNRALDQFVEPRGADLGGDGDASESRGRPSVSPSIVELTCSGPQFSQTVGDRVSCSVHVAGNVTTLEWTAEGADPDAGDDEHFSTTLTEPGTTRITVSACHEAECSSSSWEIDVLGAIAATITCVPAEARVGELVECWVDIGGGEGATAISWSWSAPEGSPDAGEGDSFATTFDSPGTKSIGFLFFGHHQSVETSTEITVIRN